MLELKEVSKFYTSNGITNIGLSNINLKLHRNEIIAITGESGSGKSTLLNVISKIDTFDEGEIYYYGNETSYFSISDMDDFRKNKVGFIFQNYNILDSYTVLDNVMIPLLLKGLSKEDAKVEAMLLIKKVGLDGREKHRGSKLSGGEKQRCVIARALAGDCDILACDEPTGNLDSQTASEIIKLIKEVAKDKLVLIVTHNYPEVEGIATRLLKMADGKIVEDITFEQVPCEENKEMELSFQPLNKKVIWSLGLTNILRTPKKTFLVCLIYFIISFCFLFVAQYLSSSIRNSESSSYFYNTFDNRLFVYGKNGTSFDDDLLSGYNYEINDFATELSYYYEFNNNSLNFCYADNITDYKLIAGTIPKKENEFILLFNSPNKLTIQTNTKNIGTEIVFEINNGSGYERFKLVGIGSYKSSKTSEVFASGCKRLQKVLNKVTPNYSLEQNGERTDIYLSLVNGNSSPRLIIPSKMYEQNPNISLYADMYKMNDCEVITYGGEKVYLELSVDGPTNLDPYFASIYSSKTKVKKIMDNLDIDNLKVVYPKEFTIESSLSKLLTEILIIISVGTISAYLIGIFFICYVILSRIYRSRVKDYAILRTLGVTKKDMAKIVNVEMIIIGYGIILFTYLLFNGLIFAVDALTFLRQIGLLTVILYFFVMIIFTTSMSKRFNKRVFMFTVRESVRGDEDDD